MNKVNKSISIVILKGYSPEMENPIDNIDAVEVIDSSITDVMKTIRCCNKKRLE